jgi:hypothetical protein
MHHIYAIRGLESIVKTETKPLMFQFAPLYKIRFIL